MKLGDASHLNVQTIPTGSLSLDIALGVGGVPRGRITEIYGPEGSGKTTVCRKIAAGLHPGLYRVFYVPLSTGKSINRSPSSKK
mgnify:CR=1 FL=1